MTTPLRSAPRTTSLQITLLFLCLAVDVGAAQKIAPVIADKGALQMHFSERASFQFGGVLGRRIEANKQEWLLRAPQANPGILEMFRVRDRKPTPQLVPWAGEFAGKYLISAVQALRMSSDAALRVQVAGFVKDLISCQDSDGYLGPFPKSARLLGNWDLWGHYHCMQGLMMWHQMSGDPDALLACRRAADLICRIYLDGSKRVFDAGSHEMNMAVIHGLGELYRWTGEERYLRMMREIEKDWERSGDYLRAGLEGVEFFQTPRPRWESLHDLQGLVELYRITGDAKYRRAFEHHWRSISRWDRHNTGGFSSGEQATGNPYSPAPIETCCTIAWMALSVDMLRLTGNPQCADELELSTFNGGVGAQHPSGRWWTYNTPMDGAREASAHTIVFQSRAGTPELNCCSVNAPRALGMLSEWAIMTDDEGLVVNHLGPGRFQGNLKEAGAVTLETKSEYPVDGRVQLAVRPARASEWTLKIRIPGWSRATRASLNGKPVASVTPGQYLALHRKWKKGDTVELELDMSLRYAAGDREALGKVSVYRGPLLLAYDQRYNSFDEQAIPALDLTRLPTGTLRMTNSQGVEATLAPWVLLDLPTAGGGSVRVCDFASAGAAGTRYRSWLAATNCPPPEIVTREPRDGGTVSTQGAVFKWTGPRRANESVAGYELVFSDTQDFAKSFSMNATENRARLSSSFMGQFASGPQYFWKVIARNAHGKSETAISRFSVDASAKASSDLNTVMMREDGTLLHASLRGKAEPEFGKLKRATGFKASEGQPGDAQGSVELDGKSQMLVYDLGEFPEEDFTVRVRVWFNELPVNRTAQVFSAWRAAMDDPVRICVERGKVFARIEAGQGYGTEGVSVETGRWYDLAAVKSGGQLTLFVNGKPGPVVTVSLFNSSSAREVAIGGNPNYSGNEFLSARFSELQVHGRALTREELNRKP